MFFQRAGLCLPECSKQEVAAQSPSAFLGRLQEVPEGGVPELGLVPLFICPWVQEATALWLP